MASLVSNFGVASSFFLLLHILTTPVFATSMVFQWKFTNDFVNDLPTCRDIEIGIQPWNTSVNTTGVPPYYMIGYATNGISRTQLIGTRLDDLQWKVDFPVGTVLALNVVDSEGTSGGIAPSLHKVVVGSSTSCVVSVTDDEKDFILTSNVTGAINTCEPWGLRIKGGVKPYNVTFLQLGSPNVTNVTMGAQDDGFTYPMRGVPGMTMIAAVNDFTGRFAFQAPIVYPQGSPDVTCTGLNSMSGSADELDKQAREAHAAAAAKERGKRTVIIAGTVVPITIVLIAGVAMWYFRWYKPRRSKPREIDIFDPTVKPYTETAPGQVLSINAFISDPSPSPGTPPKHPPGLNPATGSIASRSAHRDPDHPFDPYNQSDSASSTSQRPTSGTSRHSAGRPGFTTFPTRRPSSKAAEAGLTTSHTGDPVSSWPSSAVAESSSDQPWATPGTNVTRTTSVGRTVAEEPWATSGTNVTRTTSVGRTNTGEPELIIQHRDGGPGRVRELPPPYADRGQPDT